MYIARSFSTLISESTGFESVGGGHCWSRRDNTRREGSCQESLWNVLLNRSISLSSGKHRGILVGNCNLRIYILTELTAACLYCGHCGVNDRRKVNEMRGLFWVEKNCGHNYLARPAYVWTCIIWQPNVRKLA